jgi:hypothetical protein
MKNQRGRVRRGVDSVIGLSEIAKGRGGWENGTALEERGIVDVVALPLGRSATVSSACIKRV